MDIRGFEGLSLIDYPGSVASIIFTGGCNFRCPYCQNPGLIVALPEIPVLSPKDVIGKLAKRRKLIDGVVVTGGEPTIHKGLPDFLHNLKQLGLKIKLDTNGAFPEIIRQIIDRELVDFIAMDYKAPLAKYHDAIGVEWDVAAIKQTADLIINSQTIAHEFRTTLHPRIHVAEDVVQIANEIKGSMTFIIQQFRGISCLDKSFEQSNGFPRSEIEPLLSEVKKIIPNTILRGY